MAHDVGIGGDATPRSPLPTIDLVVLKVVSPCNLNCSYCYVYNAKDGTHLDRPARLTDEMAGTILSRLAAYSSVRSGHRMSICLHGGEPLLLGQKGFAHLVDRIRTDLGRHLGSLSVQTNGVLIDQGWARLLRDLRLSVSVSLDGPRAVHDGARVDHMGRGSHERVVAGIRHLQREEVPFSVLCVVQPGASGTETYRHLRSLGIRDFDFLLPDVSHDDWRERFGAFGPTPVADVLIPALDAWLAENDPKVQIRFFADIFKLILGDSASTDAFGGGAMPYLVIETDGSIQANDALRVCEESLGETGLDVNRHSLEELPSARRLVRDLLAGAVPTPDRCRTCPELRTCGGGYMPHRYSRQNGFNNPSVWCADIQRLFAHMRAIVDASPAPDRLEEPAT